MVVLLSEFLQLIFKKPHPKMFEVWFRYDSPVLIIAITWHETRNPFADILCSHLGRLYHDDIDLVGSKSSYCDMPTD